MHCQFLIKAAFARCPSRMLIRRALSRISGRRLDRLAPADQLLCRSIYAAAAPAYLPSHWPGDKGRAIVKQLCRDAERLADGLAIWRKADLTHIAPLLTLYKIHNTDDANAEEALPYLSAAIAQCRQLDRRSAAGGALVTPGTGAWISWTLIMMDVFGAVERAQPPHLYVLYSLTSLMRDLISQGGATDLAMKYSASSARTARFYATRAAYLASTRSMKATAYRSASLSEHSALSSSLRTTPRQ